MHDLIDSVDEFDFHVGAVKLFPQTNFSIISRQLSLNLAMPEYLY